MEQDEDEGAEIDAVVSPIKERVPRRFWSFVTGSRKYGEPHDGSDLDLVVRVSEDDAERIVDFYNANSSEYEATVDRRTSDGGASSMSLRFGGLNLIFVVEDKAFNVWRNGTQTLYDKSLTENIAIAREYAVEKFKGWRNRYLSP